MNIADISGQLSAGLANSLGSFENKGFTLPTFITAQVTPKLEQSDYQTGLIKTKPLSYSEFNANHDMNAGISGQWSSALNSANQLSSLTQLSLNTINNINTNHDRVSRRYKGALIDEHFDEPINGDYLPNQRGYHTNLRETPLSPISLNSKQELSRDSLGLSTGPNKQQQRQLNRAQRKADRVARRDLDGNGAVSGSEFMQSGAGAAVNAAAGLVGSAMNMAGNMVGQYADRPEAQQLDETQEAVRSGIYSAVSAVPVWGPLISAGLQMTDGLGKMLGTQMSNISKDAAEDAGLSRGLNNAIAAIPGVGSFLGAFAKKADEFEFDRSRVANISSAYDMSTFDSADDLSGGKFLGQRDKVNDFIAEQNRKKDLMTGISDTQKLRKMGASAMAADLAQQNRNRYGGVTGQQFAIGKEGMKFPNLNWARATLLKYKDGGKIQQDIPGFQKGRKLGLDTNVIVEGSYHAHKNHLDEINPELQDVTPKGIPVIAHDETGNPQQIAEIERKELILTKELTDKIEALYHDGSEEAMIEAGMLFANELFNNTEDNTGEVLNENN